MRTRKTKEIKKALLKKGFQEISGKVKQHHTFYYFVSGGKKTGIHTYLSHGETEYNPNLMGQIKKQLKFENVKDAEGFFDCPFSKENYEEMLKGQSLI